MPLHFSQYQVCETLFCKPVLSTVHLLPNIYSIEQIGAVAPINAFDVYISMLCLYVNLHTPFKQFT